MYLIYRIVQKLTTNIPERQAQIAWPCSLRHCHCSTLRYLPLHNLACFGWPKFQIIIQTSMTWETGGLQIKRVAFTSKNAVYFRRYRKDSAVTRTRNKSEIIINSFNLIKAYSCIYFKTPKSYSLSIFITRLLGTLRSMSK